MATLYSDQYTTAFVSEPKGKLLPDELNGRVRRIVAEYTFAAEATAGDILKLAKLPANATIIDANFSVSATHGAGTSIDVGWAASAEGNEAADADGIFDGIDTTSTALNEMAKPLATKLPGMDKKFSEEVDIQALIVANTSAADTTSLRLELFYIVD